jgi:tripartite-type tricarboxylate transporter receptor subunit TctC
MKRRSLLQAGAASIALPSLAWSQAKYPSKPINWICPYGAGGNADTRSRQLTRVMSPLLKQPILVDNKAGAGGNIGTAIIAKAKPDGYTIGLGNFAPLAVNHALFKSLPFDPLKEIEPIMLIERGPLVLMVRADSRFKSVKDVVDAAKAAPGKLSYASGGIGGTHHLSATVFSSAAGIDMIHAPYKSGSAGATDLLGGQVDMMFEQMYAAMPAIKGGKMRALAITSKVRSKLLPELPTMAEAGYPAVEVLNWQGIVGPKGLPKDIIALLNVTGNKAVQDPDVRARMLAEGVEPGGGTPEQFASLIVAEAPRWGQIVRAAKMQAD